MINEIFKNSYLKIHKKIYSHKAVKLSPSDWTEKNIFLTGDISRFTGFYKYDVSPYTREVIDCLDSKSPVEMVAVMKCAQSGFTMGVIVPGICYIISENPSGILYTAADVDLVKLSVRTRLDPVLSSSGLSHLIRPNVVKKKNQRTGDTDFSKEFAGGSLIALGVNNPNKWRQYSVKNIFADDWESAPRNDKKEGNVRSLMNNRAKSFGSLKKIFYVSTPAVKQTSNIEEVYELGDQRKWNWCCPNCNEYIPMEWRIEKEDGYFAGLKWETNEAGELIDSSVHYECQNCGGQILEKEKYELNLTGKWIPTAKPKREQYRSYQLNALVIPPGFDGWIDLINQWMEAVPKGLPVDEGKLKAFVNTQLGQTWEEKGVTPRVLDLMNNVRSYEIGIVPDITSQQDGNGKIVLITMACDLGGVMETNNEDARLDWEIVAHSSGGATYHINHGSIGTFKKSRKKTTREKENDSERYKYTYSHGQKFSVWEPLQELISKNIIGQSGDAYNIEMTIIDTSYFTKLSYDFVKQQHSSFVIGIKGYAEEEYRRLTKDTPIITRSRELLGKLYILQVNQLKDILAQNMKIKMGMDGHQPKGLMNFPQPSLGKYNLRSYFMHYEAEHRVEVIKNDQVIGFSWKKKNSSAENHFFDVSVYNLASKEIFIDIFRRSNSKYSKLTWEDYVSMLD